MENYIVDNRSILRYLFHFGKFVNLFSADDCTIILYYLLFLSLLEGEKKNLFDKINYSSSIAKLYTFSAIKLFTFL